MKDNSIERATVVGLGRFGKAVAISLADLGVEVIAVDSDMMLVEEIKEYVSLAACLDATQPGVMEELDINRSDVFVVGVGEDFEANVLLTSMALEMGISQVITRAQNPLRKRVLERVGATRVLYAEQEVGQRLAQSLVVGASIEFVNLPDDYSLRDIPIPTTFEGRTLEQLHLRRKRGLSIIAVTRDLVADGVKTRQVIPLPDGSLLLAAGDILSVIAENHRFAELE